jgi:hypothetical protein
VININDSSSDDGLENINMTVNEEKVAEQLEQPQKIDYKYSKDDDYSDADLEISNIDIEVARVRCQLDDKDEKNAENTPRIH